MRKRVRLLSMFTGVALACAFFAVASPAWAEDSFYEQYQGQGHTKAEILAKWESQKPSTGTGSAFSVNPSTVPPYAPAELTTQAVANGLNTWNFARWVAGLGDVALTSTANSNMAAGALLNAANGSIDHNPQQPSGMSQAMFLQGYNACRQANLTSGSPLSYYNNPNLMRTAVLTWLDDSDSVNIATLGHRRWMLYPQTTTSGFGAAYSNNSTYVACQIFGLPTNAALAQEKVCWPAPGYFPIELFTPNFFSPQGQAWSVSLGSSYSRSNTSGITVTMREEGGSSETFTTRSSSGNKIFAVDTATSGTDMCVIFKPQGLSPAAGKAYHITISGLRTSANTPAPDIEYDVKFFSLSETAPPAVPATGVTLDQSSKSLAAGESFTLAPTVSPANATNKAVTWSSSNPSVASVANGVVTAHAAGTATITATTVEGGHTAQCAVTVSAAPPTYTIGASALPSFGSLQTPYTQPAAQTVTLTNTGTGPVTLSQPSSTNYVIGTLSATTLAPGATATFTVRPRADLPIGIYNEGIAIAGSNGASATVNARFEVTAAPPIAYMVATPFDTWTGTGSATGAAEADPSKFARLMLGGEAVASSNYTITEGATAGMSKTTMVTLSENYLKTLANGTYVLRVEFADGFADLAITVNVESSVPTVAASGVSLSKSSLTLSVGQSTTLVATVLPANATNKGVSWASSDTSVATVDANGKVTAMKAGTASIAIATNDGGYTATCTVTVAAATQPPGSNGNQGTGGQGNQGTGNQGTGGQGAGNQGTTNQGDANTGNQGNQGNQGTGNQGNQGTGNQGGQGGQESQANVPHTGEEENAGVWMTILFASLLGTLAVLGTVYFLAKRSRKQEGIAK